MYLCMYVCIYVCVYVCMLFPTCTLPMRFFRLSKMVRNVMCPMASSIGSCSSGRRYLMRVRG